MKVAIKTKTFVNKKNVLHQALYKLTEPIDGYSEVVVSAVHKPKLGIHETFIFPYENGDAFMEALSGSTQGIFNHEEVLSSLGYEVIEEREVQ